MFTYLTGTFFADEKLSAVNCHLFVGEKLSGVNWHFVCRREALNC